MKEKVYERGYIGYSILMFLLCTISFKYSIIPINASTKVIGYTIYYGLTLFGVYSLYKVRKPHPVFAIAILLSGMFYVRSLVVLVIMLLIGLVLLMKEYNLIFKGIILLMILFIGFKTIIVILLGGNIGVEDYQKYTNGDKTYVMVMHDEGATGISFSLWEETNAANFVYIRKKIQILSDPGNVIWTDEGQLQVNGKLIDE